MIRIDCPWCGVRNEDEFSYGGDATVKRPADDGSADDWYDYVYTRNNLTHEITSVAAASPELPLAKKGARS